MAKREEKEIDSISKKLIQSVKLTDKLWDKFLRMKMGNKKFYKLFPRKTKKKSKRSR